MRTSKAQTKKREKVKKQLLRQGQVEEPASAPVQTPVDKEFLASKQKFLQGCKKAGWRSADESGVIMGIVPDDADWNTAVTQFHQIMVESGYTHSCGIRKMTKNDSKKESRDEDMEEMPGEDEESND